MPESEPRNRGATLTIQASPPDLRVVIIHWNQARSCLETIDRFASGQVGVKFTVVDNGSSSQAVEELKEGIGKRNTDCAGWIRLIEAGSNLGFGPGANVGLRAFLSDPLDGEWVVVAPHDVDPSDECLRQMLVTADAEPMAGLMCADVGDGMTPVIDPYFGGMVVPASDAETTEARWEEVDYPHGTLMMLRRGCIEEIGVFDERYFSYCEEAELALRARAAGWRIGLVRGARVQNIHIGSSVTIVDYLQTRNTLLLVRESSGRYHAFIRLCIAVAQICRGVTQPDSRPLIFDARARLLGVRDFLRGSFGPPPRSVTDG